MNICVFCGSSAGTKDVFANGATALADLIAENHTLVYGGGNVGLMGILADRVIRQRGQVIGVIPQFLKDREVGHEGITRLEVVQTMHERKKRMADLSDAFIAIPGGWGTLDELAEILTWRQLGLIYQPIALLNIDQFFDPLILQIERMVEFGFLKPESRALLLVDEDPSRLLKTLSEI